LGKLGAGAACFDDGGGASSWASAPMAGASNSAKAATAAKTVDRIR
jgi:hypothetical protein